MGTLWQDIRYGVRGLAKSPGFTIVAVLTLALGIGANTAIFSAVNGFLMRPLPVTDPGRLVVPYESDRDGGEFNEVSYPDYVEYRDRNEVFAGIVGHYTANAAIGGDDGARNDVIFGELVTGNYFDVLGVQARLGRTFLPEEDRTPGTHPVVVIGHNLWQRRYASDPGVVGRTIRLNGTAYTVIGVAPPEFVGTKFGMGMDFWVPMMMQRQIMPGYDMLGDRRRNFFDMIARLKPGVSLEQAAANMTSISRRLNEIYPAERIERERAKVVVVPEPEGRIDDPGATSVLKLGAGLAMIVVGAVLLIACANVANLLLVRATARRREIGIRLALGASRWRIIRQLLTESLLLAFAGGALGLLVAYWTADLLLAFMPRFPSFRVVLDLSPDRRVLLWTLAITLLTGVVFGLAPALRSSRAEVVPVLKGEAATIGGGRKGWRGWNLRSLLVVAQIALSLVVLVCGGLFLRSLRETLRVDPGLRTENTVTMFLDPGLLGYTDEEGKRFYSELARRVRELPEVRAAAIADPIPLGDSWNATGPVIVEGQAPPPPDGGVYAGYSRVGPGLLGTLEIPLLRGRDFAETDRAGAPDAVIVNETMARLLFPGEDAIGKRFRTNENSTRLRQIVGVVRDGKYRTLSENPRPFMFLPQRQSDDSEMYLVVGTRAALGDIVERVRAEVTRLDPRMPIYNIKTMDEHIDFALWGPRTAAALAAVSGALALGLAALGLFGVMSYTVAQRTREVGIRVALGARPRDVLGLIAKQGLVLTLVGVLAGTAAALAATRVLSGLLYGVSATDPATFACVVLLLGATALLACLVPARRATKVDPVIALRYE